MRRMLSIIITLLVNLLIETSVSFTVVVPGDPVVAHVGSTVILPCWINPPENAEALEIRWYRQEFDNPVLHYNDGKIQDIQEELYRNRTSLSPRSGQSGGLKDGDVSLRLEELTFQDDGSYRCYVTGESSYGSEEVILKITELLDDGRVNISCRSSGWHPKPSVTWTSGDGKVLHPGGSSHSRGADGMFSVHSWTAVSRLDAQLVSCSLSLRTGKIKEGRLNIQGIMPSDSSGPWKALFLTFSIFAVLGLVGLILYKNRDKITGKKPAKENCEEGTLEKQTKEAKKPAKEIREEETLVKLTKEETNTEDPTKESVVGDINIEELRKHAAEITIDSKHVHKDLMITKNRKIVRNHPGYDHTGEGFPYELCAFGAQRFTSGRHYWEVELEQENTPPKNYWLIGVVKHGNFRVDDRSALTPSNGFWFLCSDGQNGIYDNSDPPVKLSLTPRPERLGVLLDYNDGQLSFYNINESKHLLTISTTFSGSVVPLFNPGVQSCLIIQDCPKPPAGITRRIS
ncbi:butyrophilin subfamily 1 member A1-like protein [Labeo rohita]|uniref:Butyrophilin subfamily 1 member A1-like protein n=1 Tax=Labeo rohita TaxID=84645 RepID=A0A498N6A9_LABRO|nr:butyrophilin subfamily 1 member A1-like protein [Labeo rohita]